MIYNVLEYLEKTVAKFPEVVSVYVRNFVYEVPLYKVLFSNLKSQEKLY
jgi:hypothetical protein